MDYALVQRFQDVWITMMTVLAMMNQLLQFVLLYSVVLTKTQLLVYVIVQEPVFGAMLSK